MPRRLFLISCFFFLLFTIIIFKLFYWQIEYSEVLKGLGDLQSTDTLSIPAKRGLILASDGTPLVINEKAYLVYVQPKQISNYKDKIERLSQLLDQESSTISAKLSNSKLDWIVLADKIEEDKLKQILQLGIKGLGYSDSSKRFYPEGSMAAQLLGFIGKNSNGQDQGYFGIEGFYNDQLRGREGLKKSESDARGNQILSGNLVELPEVNGRDLELTIDKTVQFIAENKLKEGIEKYGAKGGTVVIMDPNTGAILAMSAIPSYDPAGFKKFNPEAYKNPIVASSYEPGSTFKVLIMAAALNEGKVSLNSKFQEDGPLHIGGYTINTWNQKYHGDINLTQILEYSSNVGMVFVQQQLGQGNLLKYLEYLGFGSLSEIDLQEESTPNLRAKDQWHEIDYATASFGQGIAVTPIQMVRAVATIANGGKLVRPYLVSSFISERGTPLNIEPVVEKIIFRKEIASQVAEMMVKATENGETKYLKPRGFKIAGKTGTAQIPIAGHYDTSKTIASFVGFAPYDKPKFIMLVTVNEPTSSPWGSETAAPIFFSIADELFNYYGISPTY